ncbi:DUF4843 domain-containing protein [Chitinophaga horti]|uniref:DUF4843 domain-containing protein n=1 Tax=Chitinophaga horti TaxID=2920382 RepID=A0ABY6J694_9BACT|nr:DUF4843 domain-containing protein [Chitinophaga horti]UYQ94117.1 DUF4843 domain-containing protein [Chitinophaga horti]
MKNIVTGLLISCLIATGLAGCSEDRLDLYNQNTEGASIYFKEKFDNLSDRNASTPFENKYITMGYTPLTLTDTIIIVPVAFTGLAADTDRTYEVEVIDSLTSMEQGVDYEFMKPFVMKAGRYIDTIQIRLFRSQRMRDTTLDLRLLLKANGNFNTNVPLKMNYAGTYQGNVVTYAVSANDITGKPFLWTSPTYKTFTEGYFGTYSKTKLLLMLDVLNVKLETVTIEPTPPARFSLDYFLVWSQYMVYWLGKEKGEGRIYYDEFGAEIKMGPNAK